MVYFMQAGGCWGPYKIGVSQQPEVRRRQVQRGFDEHVALVAVIPGGIVEEQRLHQHFSVGRLRGEWFLAGTPGLGEFASTAAHMEGLWPEDTESPCVLELLDVLVPDLELRASWTEACRGIVATGPEESWYFPGPSEEAHWRPFL